MTSSFEDIHRGPGRLGVLTLVLLGLFGCTHNNQPIRQSNNQSINQSKWTFKEWVTKSPVSLSFFHDENLSTYSPKKSGDSSDSKTYFIGKPKEYCYEEMKKGLSIKME